MPLIGPSLCLYNNAVFSDEDWHGIRKLSDSIKKNNPLQVGTFGLGFKSIFHCTDTVTIISGGTVLFMDPSEPEDKMCRSLPLASLSQVLPPPACQRAFAHRLTTHHQATGHFPATLFWFPLRQSPRIYRTQCTPQGMCSAC
ncbi:Sacsin [Chionoecetes opilio]|uniref:Sacsin n=1 Tax=Chionoecetes opilio TaxID=41210 RepID=A0A8J8WET6_CHIOP|nr:Sacsin [Chionoecetes opilio]